MDKSTVIKAIDFFEKHLLDNGIKLSKIILFGSYANGNADHESDIDLVVVSNDFDGWPSLSARLAFSCYCILFHILKYPGR